MTCVRFSRPDLDDPGLAARWRSLAAVSDGGAFLSWSWVGCLATERYPEPLLAEYVVGGEVAGLALLNRRRKWGMRTAFLQESGDAGLDAVFTEHNGVLAAPGVRKAAMAAVLAGLRGEADRVVLPGIDDAGLAAVRGAGGLVVGLRSRVAPFARLEAGGGFLEGMSRNTRAQVRRSDRSYAAGGAIVVERAQDVGEGLEWLGALSRLHEATWVGRGVVSPFLSEPVQRFHRSLLARGLEAGEVEVVRVAAGARVVGYLLNLCSGGRVAAYQSGFDYGGAGVHEKPGLTCHHAAIEDARGRGMVEYDFLGGDSRYKRSLATGSRALHWLTWKPSPVLFGVEGFLRGVLGR